MIVRPAALALCLLAAACGQKADTKNSAAEVGEVLPGSISDAMIELDTSTALPPMAPVKPDPATKAGPDASDAAAEDEPVGVNPPAPDQAPAVSPKTE